MSGERLLRILALMSAPDESGETSSLCRVAAEIIGMSGAGVMVFEGDLPRGSVCTTNPVSTLIEDLQYTLGEGPCVDAHSRGVPVAEADLAAPTVSRWPAFGPPAVARGARAVFGFPVRIGAVRLGALNLYRDQPGGLSDDQHADALVMADVAAQSILSLQADAPPGTLAAELEAGADFHLVVHQAAGMVSIQLDIRVAEALLRLRAHAFATETPLAEVAQSVVDRQLRFAGPDRPSIPDDE
ncbi:MAG: GAF and ANTAR domain-containing protein [Acidimicrobiales bacterium]